MATNALLFAHMAACLWSRGMEMRAEWPAGLGTLAGTALLDWALLLSSSTLMVRLFWRPTT